MNTINNTVSLMRIKLLLQRYFIENWKRDVFYFLLSFVLGLWSPRVMLSFNFVFLCFLALCQFKSMNTNNSKIHQLSIPASTLDHLICNSFIVFIYFWVLLFAAAFVGDLCHTAFIRHGLQTSFSLDNTVIPFYLITLTVQSCLLFVGIHFQKTNKLLLFMLIVLAGIALMLLNITILNHIGWNKIAYTFGYLFETNRFEISHADIIGILGACVLIVYFWVLSFFSLRESEA